jgi:hypothetical protein
MAITTATEHKQITAILRHGVGRKLLDRLFDAGIAAGDLHRARGLGVRPVFGSGSMGTSIEWEVLTVLVPLAEADYWFEVIFVEGDVGRLHGGFIYMHSTDTVSLFQLPEIASEEDNPRTS